jgi:malate dehydrogenase
MREVAIIGAGELGGMVAYALARRSVAAVVRLVDDHARVAEGKALDITEAAPLAGFTSEIVGGADLMTAAGAEVLVIADRAGGTEWQGEEGIGLLRRLDRLAPRAVIVCAGSQQQELVERGVRELGLTRTRLFGSATHALAAAATAMVALELDASPRDVAVAILGVPPLHTVVGWESASVGGFALTRLLSEPSRHQLTRRIEALWPAGPYALASAAAAVVEALATSSRRLMTCVVGPDDAGGVRERAGATAVRLGPSGIVEVMSPALSVAERVALDNALLL